MESQPQSTDANFDQLLELMNKTTLQIGPAETHKQIDWTGLKLSKAALFVKKCFQVIANVSSESKEMQTTCDHLYNFFSQYTKDTQLAKKYEELKKLMDFKGFYEKCPLTESTEVLSPQFIAFVDQLKIDTLKQSPIFRQSQDKNSKPLTLDQVIPKDTYTEIKNLSETQYQAEFLVQYCNDFILDEFKSLLEDVCQECQLKTIVPQVKGPLRIIQKMKENGYEQKGTFCLYDLVRASFIFTNEKEFKQCLTYLLQDLGYFQKVAKFQNNLEDHLKNINMVLIIEGKQGKNCFAEVQFLWGQRNNKSDINHFFYELDRCGDLSAFTRSIQKHCSQQFLSPSKPKMPEIAVDPKNIELLNFLRTEKSIKSQEIYDVMLKVDRKNFVAHGYEAKAYEDRPLPIGWNINLSAPHMYAYALEMLNDTVKKAKKILVVGTGGGYMATCFAELMTSPQAKVYQIDQVKGLVDQSAQNAMKGNTHLLSEKKLISLTQDGRQGLAKYAPYDVIYVGRAVDQDVVDVLEEQISVGGMMWVPTPCEGAQEICWISKDQEGCSRISIMSVRFVPLTQAQ